MIYCDYVKAIASIRDADLLLFRPARFDPLGRIIAKIGRGPYCHAAMVRMVRSGATCLEMVSTGGREYGLREYVRQRPGQIDYFEANPAGKFGFFNRPRAVTAMREIILRRYGYWSLLRLAIRHFPVFRLMARPDTDDEILSGRPPMCSQAVAMACRAGGVDPVPLLADRSTEPCDLARSSFFKYRFTLTP